MVSQADLSFSSTSYDVTSAFASSVKGKVILITGVNSGGIGGETARALAAQDPKLLIFTGRSTSKVNIVVEEIQAKNSAAECRIVECDLSSQASVRKAATEINGLTDHIDIVINNAGVMALPERTLSEDGIELQFGTNHIGHFLLTNLILPKLVAAAAKAPKGAVRIVNVSSFGHTFSPVRFSDLKYETPSNQLPKDEQPNSAAVAHLGLGDDVNEVAYNQIIAYGNSKSANILFTLGLNKRLYGSKGIASFALHPGSIETELGRHIDPDYLAQAREKFKTIITSKTLSQGASTQLVAALSPELKVDGVNVYLDDCQLKDASPWARDEAAAERLWSVSEDLVKEKFAGA